MRLISLPSGTPNIWTERRTAIHTKSSEACFCGAASGGMHIKTGFVSRDCSAQASGRTCNQTSNPQPAGCCPGNACCRNRINKYVRARNLLSKLLVSILHGYDQTPRRRPRGPFTVSNDGGFLIRFVPSPVHQRELETCQASCVGESRWPVALAEKTFLQAVHEVDSMHMPSMALMLCAMHNRASGAFRTPAPGVEILGPTAHWTPPKVPEPVAPSAPLRRRASSRGRNFAGPKTSERGPRGHPNRCNTPRDDTERRQH